MRPSVGLGALLVLLSFILLAAIASASTSFAVSSRSLGGLPTEAELDGVVILIAVALATAVAGVLSAIYGLLLRRATSMAPGPSGERLESPPSNRLLAVAIAVGLLLALPLVATALALVPESGSFAFTATTNPHVPCYSWNESVQPGPRAVFPAGAVVHVRWSTSNGTVAGVGIRDLSSGTAVAASEGPYDQTSSGQATFIASGAPYEFVACSYAEVNPYAPPAAPAPVQVQFLGQYYGNATLPAPL